MTQSREIALRNASEPLRLPTSLSLAVQVALSAGTILIIILIGSSAGGEFSIRYSSHDVYSRANTFAISTI